MVQLAEERPPFVTFETRSIEDRNGTIKQGHYVGKDVDFAIITPAGSKDRIERVAEEWLTHISNESQNGRFPANWVNYYRQCYTNYRAGRQLPVHGTPIENWPAVTPSLMKSLLSMNVRTVEEVAAANEETLARMGLGARALKDRARAFLETASGPGAVAEELAAMRVRLATLETALAEANAKLALAQAQAAAGAQGNESLDSDTITAADILG